MRNKRTERIGWGISSLGFLAIVISFTINRVLPNAPVVDFLSNYGKLIFFYVGLFMLVITGRFYNGKFRPIVLSCAGLVAIGVAMKIMHLAGAMIVFNVAILGMLFTYIIHFARIKNKNKFDVLKMLVVFTTVLMEMQISGSIHLPNPFHFIQQLILGLCILTYARLSFWKPQSLNTSS